MAKQNSAETKASQSVIPAIAINATPELTVLGMTVNVADMAKLLDEGNPTDFVRVEDDIWKGNEVGDTLYGVLMAKEESNFVNEKTGEAAIWWHFVCRSMIDGAIISKRVLGVSTLSRQLKTVEPGTTVEIEYKGETKNNKGQPVFLYDVRTPKKSR